MRKPTQKTNESPSGVREQKRLRTRERIAAQGLRLFLTNGYETTTLDAIAVAADISRRTFFSYFKSKEDIVAAWQASAWDAVLADIMRESPDQRPLEVVRDVLVLHVSQYTTEQMTAIDRLIRSSETLMANKQASYARQEQMLFATLCEVWRQPQRQQGLRIVAMLSIGAMRLAIDAWHRSGGKRPVVDFLRDAFADLQGELGTEPMETRVIKKKTRKQ